MATLEKVRFLVVDDNVHMTQLVKTLLKGFGATQVFEARTTAEATDHLGRSAIDILILDHLLAGEDGTEYARSLRASSDAATAFLPIIMLSAHAERARVQAARDAGVNAFCAKPVTPLDLFRKIVAVIEQPRPFVRADAYHGPDRRRRLDPDYVGCERRAGSENEGLGPRGAEPVRESK